MMKLKLRWILEFEYPIYDEDGEFQKEYEKNYELNKFQHYIEEFHCQENFLDYLNSESQEGFCKLCSIGKVELLEVICNDDS